MPVTVDQIVARNIRFWRKAARMTQEDLGALTGWTAANISAAERSAEDGRDRRRFDAQALVTFSRALGVPLLALFLPPVDEGTDRRYIFSDSDSGGWLDMHDLMRVVYPDSDREGPVMDKYRAWLTHVVEHFMEPEWAEEMARWLGKHEPQDVLAARVRRLRAGQYALTDLAGEWRQMADALAAELDGGEQP